MTSAPIPPDRVRELHAAVRRRYASVAHCAEGQFPYPVGRASALQLGYEADWLARVPEAVLARFVGVGNPFAVRRPQPGERVLDLGCGCGLDLGVARQLVGPQGRAVGVDLTPEMLALADAGVQARIEALPFADGAFDLALSNGVLNLVPDKAAAFAEIARVLRPGGALAAADLLVTDAIPDAVLASADAWST